LFDVSVNPFQLITIIFAVQYSSCFKFFCDFVLAEFYIVN